MFFPYLTLVGEVVLVGDMTVDRLPHFQATVRDTLPDEADLEAAVEAIESG